ncbi:hypothetical protein EYF80_062077 [Liparis tanakae]|uniref:Uncharacterized protein n=1 Tax=Liparis tanakae TaxID=230148 RepID=A0A4Z2EFX0_9TELE|nr:hypothetical protein EYF80_062077 [Liparis tanakae]
MIRNMFVQVGNEMAAKQIQEGTTGEQEQEQVNAKPVHNIGHLVLDMGEEGAGIRYIRVTGEMRHVDGRQVDGQVDERQVDGQVDERQVDVGKQVDVCEGRGCK